MMRHLSVIISITYTSEPAEWLSGKRPLSDREVAGSIPGRVIPKTLKMVLAALSLGAQH